MRKPLRAVTSLVPSSAVPASQEYFYYTKMSTPLYRWIPSLDRFWSQLRRHQIIPHRKINTRQRHHHHHHHQPPRYLSLSYSSTSRTFYSIVLTFVFIVLNSSSNLSVMARPVSPSDKWRNPCNINFEASGSGETVDFKGSDAKDSYRGILQAVTDASEYTDATKTEFVMQTFGDPTFMTEFEWISYDWLPKIPAATADHLASLQVEHIKKSLTDSYHYLQYFAVAIDQMILDQIMYEGNFLDAYRKIEENLRTALCQFQQSIALLGLKPHDDVRKEVMSEEYRSIHADTTRNVRDYIILRDHLNTLNYISKVFHHYVKKLDET